MIPFATRALIFAVLSSAVAAGGRAAQVNPTFRLYPVILDRVFHVESPESVYVLRYSLSSIEPEMQVVFSVPFEAACRVRVWHLPPASRPLLVQLYELFGAQPSLTPEDAIAKLSIFRRTIELPCDGPVATLLREGVSIPVTTPSERTVGVDGVRYRFEAFMGATHLLYEAPGGSFRDPGDDAVLRWMASVGVAIRSILAEDRDVFR